MFENFIPYLLYTLLTGFSITSGFFLTSVYLNYINTEANLEDEPMSELSEESLLELKNKTIVLNLEPLLMQTIRMYYDLEEDAFCYYSERETIYKYLDIVARKYVLEHHCKQIYVELGSSEEKVIEDTTETTGPFVSKKKKTKKVYEKKFIRFIYKGNEKDYKQPEVTKSVNDMNILDFLKMHRKGEDSDEYEKVTKED
jgi:hypothetical protein